MARSIVVSWKGEESSFGFTKVDRDSLYGSKQRLVVDEKGEACVGAYLTSDGAAVIPPGGVAMLYVDPSMDIVERSKLVAVDAEGKPLPIAPSTLGVSQPLTGPVEASRLLDHAISAVYQLANDSVSPGLLAALEEGKIFETRFNYREDYADAAAFLVKNEAGIFALIGTPTGFELLRREEVPVAEASSDEEDGDLDFNMM